MSRLFVIVSLTFVALVLGVGCRAFSKNVKDEVPVVESRPSLSSEEASNAKAAPLVDGVEKKVFNEGNLVEQANAEFNAGNALEKLALEKPQDAVSLYKKAEEHYYNSLQAFPRNASTYDAWARIALKAMSQEQCADKLAPLVKKHPGAQQLAIIYSRLLFRQKKYQEAQDVLQACLEINMDSLLLCREILLDYLRSGNVLQGNDFYKWMWENSLVSPREVIMYGTWWNGVRRALARGDKDKLPAGFAFAKEHCDEIVHQAALRLVSMGEELVTEKDMALICAIGLFLAEASEKELHGAFLESKAGIPEISRSVAFVLMVAETSIVTGNMEQAMAAAVMLEKNRNTLTEEVLVRLVELFKKLKEASHAARVLEEIVLRQQNQNNEALDELLMQYLLAKEYDNVILTAQLYSKPTGYSRYAVGLAYKEKKNFRAAYREFLAAEKVIPQVQGFWLYMQLSIVCQELKLKEQVVQYAEKAWKMKPDEPMLCNFYGYTLADNGMQLEFAQELIEKALKEAPKNVAYLDSLAWVLFKRGESVRAEAVMRELLEIGIDDSGDDGEIQMHIGDILFANGKKDEAVKYWKEAVDNTKNEDIRKELILKINK